MKNKLIYTLLIGLFLLFTGCESNRNESKSISKMNIGDATTLFIASSANGMAEISPKGNNDAAVATKRLFKITEDGVVEDVVYTDEEGNEITETYIPENMYFIENSPYFFAEFRGDFGMKQYLVNKHTGAVYDASGVIDLYSLAESDFFANAPLFVTDGYGNIYYSSYDYNSGNDRVHKIDISNINQIVHEALTPITDNLDRFVSSTNGELFYEYYSGGDSKYRLRSAGGKLIPFSLRADFSYNNMAFRGLDGKLHILDRNCLQTISFSDYGDITLDTIINVEDLMYDLGCDAASPYNPYLVTLENRILAIGKYSAAMVLDSDNKDDITGNVFDINDNMRIRDFHYTDSYIYCCGEISGNFSLVRIDPYTYSKEVIMQNNDYEIYSFTVLNDETIMFNGLRLSDGKNIIASIDKNGKFKILDETLNSQESVLERIQ
ncbi:MAG: hypothetical protein IKU78_00285 [Paludibacteraceae bacterium]|nr:hypothetical protein [Paludibacteraceae bacterium]